MTSQSPTPPGIVPNAEPGPHEGPEGLDSLDPHPPEEGDPYDNHRVIPSKPDDQNTDPYRSHTDKRDA